MAKRRTTQQNRMYWRLCRVVALHLIDAGNESDEEDLVHKNDLLFKSHFFIDQMRHGVEMEWPLRSSTMSTTLFSEFFENSESFALETWGVGLVDY